MGIFSLLALALASAQPAVPTPPADWSALPPMPLTGEERIQLEDTVYVMRQAERRTECRRAVVPMPSPQESPRTRMRGMRVELAVLIAPDGALRQIIAAPGPCNAIRDYARSLVNARYRGHVRAPGGSAPVWFRTGISFSWSN